MPRKTITADGPCDTNGTKPSMGCCAWTPKKCVGPRGRPKSPLPGAWGRLARACGGSAELADVLDVTATTLYRWAHGLREPRGNNRIEIIELAGLCHVEPPI